MADNRYGRDDDWRGMSDRDRHRDGGSRGRDRRDGDYRDERYGEPREGWRESYRGSDRDFGGQAAGNDWGRGGYSAERDQRRGGMSGEGMYGRGGYGGMGGQDEDRSGQGWMSRAADAVGSWFGGGHEGDRSMDEQRDRGYGGQGGYTGGSQSGFGQGGLMGGGYAGSQSGYGGPQHQDTGRWGQGGPISMGGPDVPSGGRGASGFGQPHRDEHYLSLRERHLQDLDRQYEAFRKERQDRFSAEFEEWRRNRGGAGSTSYEQANNPAATGASTTLTGTADPNRATDMMKDADSKSDRK